MEDKFSQRIELLNNGRAPYLDFLRNLTPQVALLSFAFLLYVKLDFNRFDLANWLPTTAFFVLIGAFFLALYSNTTIFFQKCFGEPHKEWEKRQLKKDKVLRIRGFTGWPLRAKLLKSFIKERWITGVEVLFSIIFTYIAIAIVIVTAMQMASKVLRDSNIEKQTTACVSDSPKNKAL